ncbi:hypothetical protein GCM10022212_31400 [Actimicrobium antarcticum]|uniref:Transglycosylase SLT domain-containing protein n=2 Tax=Actimicrobium antarcticum TaxID=1051899 RepID=A0ABP7TSR2_9BURK
MIAGVGLCAAAAAATPDSANAVVNIYRAELADGSVRFASQRLDPGYVLYLPGERVAATSDRTRAGTSAAQAVLEPDVLRLAHRHGVDSVLVLAVIEVESRFRAQALSPKGAFGPMQLMPDTARRYGIAERAGPVQNIDAGIRYLKDLLARHEGNEALALASYNAGSGAVLRHGQRIPPYRETLLYVAAVLARAQVIRNLGQP